MNSKTAKMIAMIARCAKIQQRPRAALRAQWLATTPRGRGRLKAQWLDEVSRLRAKAKKLKTRSDT